MCSCFCIALKKIRNWLQSWEIFHWNLSTVRDSPCDCKSIFCLHSLHHETLQWRSAIQFSFHQWLALSESQARCILCCRYFDGNIQAMFHGQGPYSHYLQRVQFVDVSFDQSYWGQGCVWASLWGTGYSMGPFGSYFAKCLSPQGPTWCRYWGCISVFVSQYWY